MVLGHVLGQGLRTRNPYTAQRIVDGWRELEPTPGDIATGWDVGLSWREVPTAAVALRA
jgi:hypothetical protein